MEIVLGLAVAAFVVLIGYYIMKESDEERSRKEYAAARIKRMQAERERAVQEAYERQAHKHITPRSAPITTGRPKNDTSVPAGLYRSPQVSRKDNSFQTDNVVDSYTTPTYHPSHSSGGHSSHSCSSSSSSSSDSSSSSSDSGGGGCD
jgi:hypothetical protein